MLNLLAYRNLGDDGAKYWEWVSPATASTCGISLKSGGVRVIIPDFEKEEALRATDELEAFRSSGIRAAQSTPLKSRDGQLLGMLSTHWKHPTSPPKETSGSSTSWFAKRRTSSKSTSSMSASKGL